jgi:hypothetical protein
MLQSGRAANRSIAGGLIALSLCGSALAGPPFITDDPEPIPHRHWELYVASQSFHDRDGWTGTAPHFEANYGVIPNVQLHVIAPLAYSVPTGEQARYGYGDTEVGAKIRFIQEGEWIPQVGTYPMYEIPTGSRSKGLGNGSAQVFVPLWLQKSFGPWTTYGGPGIWIDVGHPETRWWFAGWELQRRLARELTVGGEVLCFTPKVRGEPLDVRFNVGAIIDLSETHHILFSAGRGIVGPNLFQAYFAYIATLGPD